MRRTSINHAFCLLKYAPQHEYVLQCYPKPIPERLRRERFDAIVLDTTFLCWRWGEPRVQTYDRLREEYAFVGESDAVKIALPQDEYDHTEILDDWLTQWRVDVIYSVCFNHRSLFYPRASAHAEIREGLTGFVDDADIELAKRFARPFADREIDVGYRARKLPPQFGSFGMLKAEIGERFLERMSGKSLRVDISLRPEDVLNGEDWLRFLGNSRFTLGCESGSSLLDPRGEIRMRVLEYVAENPNATFDEVEAHCFPGEDRRGSVFSAISPRIFETTVARSCNILVPGDYLDVLRPNEHYIPLAEDLSNAEEVLEAMRDTRAVQDKIEACYSVLIGASHYRYSTFANELLDAIRVHQRKKDFAPPSHSVLAPIDALARNAFVEQTLRTAEAAADELLAMSARLTAAEVGFQAAVANLASAQAKLQSAEAELQQLRWARVIYRALRKVARHRWLAPVRRFLRTTDFYQRLQRSL
jgi:hypothetical protein